MTKSDIVSRFIISSDHSKDRAEEFATRLLPYGRVTQDGKFVIEAQGISKDNIVKLCLTLRFVANALQPEILPEVTPLEITHVLGERPESVGSRLSQLSKPGGFSKKVAHGKYIALGYRIDNFISQLEKNGIEVKGASTKKTVTNIGDRSLAQKGVGADIQKLIDQDFFKNPRLVSEIEKELRTDARYHDKRVLDRTLRLTFVRSRKSLKRVPNSEGGRAQWKYVNR